MADMPELRWKYRYALREKGAACSVCREEFDAKSAGPQLSDDAVRRVDLDVMVTPCGHLYCFECYGKMYAASLDWNLYGKCGMCRRALPLMADLDQKRKRGGDGE